MACEVVTTSAPLNLNVIGPRSVIVPADPIEWDASTSYEYLTLVASADFGQGYIAKKDVPAGTPLTNTDYWIPVAIFNAQLAEIMRQMSKVIGIADKVSVNSQSVYKATNGSFAYYPFADWYDASLDKTYNAQSMCATNDSIVVFGENNDTDLIAWQMNFTSGKVNTFKFTDTANHVNSAFYRNGTYYIIKSSGVLQLRNSSLEFINNINLPVPATALSGYGTDEFIARDANNVYLLNSSFEVTTQFAIDNSPNTITQSIYCDGDIVYCVNNTSVQSYDINGNKLGILRSYNYCELEDICVINGNAYVLINPSNKGFIISNFTVGSTIDSGPTYTSACELIQNDTALNVSNEYQYSLHNGYSAILFNTIYKNSSFHVNSDFVELGGSSLKWCYNSNITLTTDIDNVKVGFKGIPPFNSLNVLENVQIYSMDNSVSSPKNLTMIPSSNYPTVIDNGNGFTFNSVNFISYAAQTAFSGTTHSFIGCTFKTATAQRRETTFLLASGAASPTQTLAATDLGKCLNRNNSSFNGNNLYVRVSDSSDSDAFSSAIASSVSNHSLSFMGSGCTSDGKLVLVSVNTSAESDTYYVVAAKLDSSNGYVRTISIG